MPKVSVLMPVYKTNPRFLAEAIESILSQTMADFEFIILDDCPQDPREELIRKYSDSRIRYVKNKVNMGISESRNKLLSLATGEYLAIFDHDDISLPERLEKQVKYLDEHPDVGVVSSNVKFMISGKCSKYPESNFSIKNSLYHRCTVAHTASMIRKSLLIKHNITWNDTYSPAEDYMLWAMLMDKTMFHNIQEVLVYYRDHDRNTSHQQADKMLDRDWRVKQFIAKNYPNQTTGYREWFYLFGCVPLLRITKRPAQVRYSLFGFIPLIVKKVVN